MRLTLRGVAMAGVLAAAGTSGIGVSTARACDHGPAPGFGPTPPWGYGGVVPPTIRFGSLPDYDHCPVCHPRSFFPPPCPPPLPPPCRDDLSGGAGYRYVSYREYRRSDYPLTYPGSPAPDLAPQPVATYEVPSYPVPPTKQAPAVYGSPQYPGPSSRPSSSYGYPRAQAPYPTQAPPGGYDQAPPLPTPNDSPQP